MHAITNNDHKSINSQEPNDTIEGHPSEAGTQQLSVAGSHRKSSTSPGVVGPRFGTIHDVDLMEPMAEKSTIPEEDIERKASNTWTFGNKSRNSSAATEHRFNIAQGEEVGFRPDGSRQISMPVSVRPIAEYDEYDSDGLDLTATADIEVAGDDLVSNPDSTHSASSDEDPEPVGQLRGRYEERVPHKLV
ncbi:hypothetical protein ABW20_dc0110392 [Dactylellina cionopaga]|nr:hypothetical protein ABW20_dc0110392 [Dactylellina cionopaga]